MDSTDNIFNAEAYWINHDKWLEGIKLGKDPGNQYVLDWVESNANSFRKKWEKSICSKCNDNSECGFLLKPNCDNFKGDFNE